MKNIITVLLIGFFSFNLSANDIYVAVDGDDKNSGTIERPLATLKEAFDRAVRCNSDGGVTIYMREGTYVQKQKLRLTAGHSGFQGAPITVKPYNGEEVRISGGMPIKNWTAIGGGVYVADVPEGTYFRQMFINDQIAIKARYPNYQEHLSTAYSTTNGFRLVVNDSKLGQSGLTAEDFEGAELYMRKVWAGSFMRVQRVEDFSATGLKVVYDGPSAVAELRAVSFWNGVGKKPKICFRDSKAFLDVENEWFLDREESKVYYIPPAGIDPNQANISAPTFERLFDFEGLGYVNFEGLILEQSGHFPLNDIYAASQGGFDYTTRSGAGGSKITSDTLSLSGLELRNCHNITFRRNVIRNHSSAGIGLPQACRDITIQGNAIYNIGGSGVQGGLHWNVRRGGSFPEASKEVLIADNYIFNVGTEIFSASGVNFYYLHNSTIRNNEILWPINNGMHFGVNYLINKRFPVSETRGIGYIKDLNIEQNRIADWAAFNYDNGGIHTLGFMMGNILIEGNVIEPQAVKCGLRCANVNKSVYLDNSTTNTFTTNNLGTEQIGTANRVDDLTGTQNGPATNSFAKFQFHQETYGLKLPRSRDNQSEVFNKWNSLGGKWQLIRSQAGVRADYQDMEAYLPSGQYRVFEILKPGNRYEY